MKTIVIKLLDLFANFIYLFFRPLKIKNKVTFISRQSNKKTEDISILEKRLKQQDKSVEVIVLCKRLEKTPLSIIKYCFHVFIQMYHLSTSKVIVLDSQCGMASLLKKKNGTVIIQMWHAVGAFKKFGYSILDQEEGRSSSIAKLLKMHKNYDYVLTSSNYTKKYFAEAFNYDSSKLIVMPLPRVEKLLDKNHLKNVRDKVLKNYPQLKKKKNIVYAPTFRMDKDNIYKIKDLINSIDYDKYNLIIKFHPSSKIKLKDDRVIFDKKFSTIDIMNVSDYVITDYSAIVFEAAILEKPLFFYAYDYKDYYRKRDFYLDYKKEMPGVISDSAVDIFNAIKSNNYDLDKVKDFSKKFVELDNNLPSESFAKFILEKM